MKKKAFKRLRKNTGLSLIELAAVMAILASLLLGAMQYFGIFFKSLKATRVLAGRDSLFASIETQARSPANLNASWSAAANAGTQFQLCLNTAGAANQCTATGAPESGPTGWNPPGCFVKPPYGINPASPALGSNVNCAQPFTLIGPTGTAIAGTPAAPVFYNLDGKVCPAIDNVSCVYQATSYFYAICPKDALGNFQSNCQTADAVAIYATFGPGPGVDRIPGSSVHPSTSVSKMPFTIQTKTIRYAAVNLQCPTGTQQYMYGTNPDGTPICQTLQFPQCPAFYKMAGFDFRFQKVLCTPDNFAGGFNRRASSAGGGCTAADWNSNANPCCKCDWVNPFTNKCTCPAGYQEVQLWQFSELVGTTTTPSNASGDPPLGAAHTHGLPIPYYSYPFCDDPGPPFQAATCPTINGQGVGAYAFVCVQAGGLLPGWYCNDALGNPVLSGQWASCP